MLTFFQDLEISNLRGTNRLKILHLCDSIVQYLKTPQGQHLLAVVSVVSQLGMIYDVQLLFPFVSNSLKVIL